jgi:hypothetical protein
MILPTKGIAPQRSLLAVGAQTVQLLEEPLTVSQAWVRLKNWRNTNGHTAPIPFWWFALALDTLYALGLVKIEQELLTRVDRNA